MNFTNVEFIKSAATPDAFIRDGRPQLAFAGRSNVGKSSVINSLTRRKNLARVGSQPGKTSHVNYFLIDGRAYIADLPGYGYANVPKAERARWGRLLEAYFTESGLVTMGVMLLDVRRKPTADDETMMEWFRGSGCPVVVVANKVDKVKKGELAVNLQMIRETLSVPNEWVLVPCSAETGVGRGELISAIERVLLR